MSVLDRLDELMPSVSPPHHERSSTAWADAAAGAGALAIGLLFGDIAAAVTAAATVVVLVHLVTGRHPAPLTLHARPLRSAIVGGSAGMVAGIVSATTATSGSVRDVTALAAPAALGWIAVSLLGPVPRRLAANDQRRVALTLSITATVAAVLPIVVGAGHRAGGAVAIATPLALVTCAAVLAAYSDEGDELGRSFRAVLVGVSAAALSIVTVGSSRPATSALVAAALVGVAVSVVLARVRGGSRRSTVRPFGAQQLATMSLLTIGAVAAGASTSLVGLVALAAVFVLDRNTVRELDRVDVAPADTSARTARRVVTGLTVAAIGIRLWAPRGLWLDEATSVHQARLGLVQMIRQIYETDNHPPLHHVIMWLDIRIVGDSELALRLPSIAMGALLVPMLYVTAREVFDRRVGVMAAAIGTIAPLAVWYGQEARMYSQFMLLAAVSVYAQIRILRARGGGGLRWWAVFTLSSVALVYTQYFAVLHVAATLLVVALELARRVRHRLTSAAPLAKRFALSLLGLAILIAPLVPYALHQAANNQRAGFGFDTDGVASGSTVVPPPGIYGLLTNAQWAFLGYQPDALTQRLVALWPVGLLVLLLMLGRQRRRAHRGLLLIAALPVMVIFAASFVAAKSRSLAEVRYFAGAVPVLFVLLAAGLATVISSRRLQLVALGVVLSTMGVALVVQETRTDNPRLYQYREAVGQVEELASPGDVVLYAPFYLDYVLEYYSPGVAVTPISPDPALAASSTDGADIGDDSVADAIALAPRRIFVLVGASFAGTDSDTAAVGDAIAALEAGGRTLAARHDFAQVTIWEFS